MGRPADWRRRLSRKQVAGDRVRVRLSLYPREKYKCKKYVFLFLTKSKIMAFQLDFIEKMCYDYYVAKVKPRDPNRMCGQYLC